MVLDFRLNILDSFILYISSQHLAISLNENYCLQAF
jgi:hypothetical protein